MTFLGIFIILHGLVHVAYLGQSWRWFEMRPGMVWPDGSWFFSGITGEKETRTLAGVLSLLITILFVIAGTGLLVESSWWRGFNIASVALSTFLYLFFWDGKVLKLNDKGGYGILINIALLFLTLVLK